MNTKVFEEAMMNNKNKLMKISAKLTSGIAIGFLLAFGIYGQLSGRPDRGYQQGNSYAISDIENINMTGGNVLLNIPLASLPKGRGTSPGFSVSLSYDSKLWDSEQKWEEDGLNEFNAQADYTRNLLKPAEEGGWQIYGSYKLNVVNRNKDGNFEKCVAFNTNYSKNGYAWKVEMRMPGGGVANFRPNGSGSAYQDYHKDGFSEINPNGYAEHWGLSTYINDPHRGTGADCSLSTTQVTTSGMNYYSTDGSGIRLFIPYYPGGIDWMTQPVAWKMFYPDGTLVENVPADDPTVQQRITDLNGNWVKIRPAGNYNGIFATKIEDGLGRYILVSLNSVRQYGVNGAELITTLTWKNNWIYRNYKTVAFFDGITVPAHKLNVDIRQSLQVIDEITMPVQAGGFKYKFTYHGDLIEPATGNYTNGWGELASVELPSTAKAEYKYLFPETTSLAGFLDVLNNSITRKDLKYDEIYDGQSVAKTDTWLYQTGGNATITGPDGAVSGQSSYYSSPYILDDTSGWNSGLVYAVTNPDG